LYYRSADSHDGLSAAFLTHFLLSLSLPLSRPEERFKPSYILPASGSTREIACLLSLTDNHQIGASLTAAGYIVGVLLYESLRVKLSPATMAPSPCLCIVH